MTLHVIHFTKSISRDTFAVLQNTALSALQQKASKLQINISSDGGNNDQGFTAYHFLRSLPIPITTHCIGNIESMAVIMYLAGSKRLMVSHGKVKIHPMHWNFVAGNVDHNRLSEFVTSLNFDAERYANIFAERTQGASKSLNVKNHLSKTAKLLNATDALSYGIATEISDPNIPEKAIIWWI